MNGFLRLLCAVLIPLLVSPLQAGHLKVTLTPTQVVTAGAQWRVNGGEWRGSGTTAKSLPNGTHLVEFKAVPDWIAPAPLSVAMSGGGTTTRTAAYVQEASLSVTLSPAGQWRVNGGAWLGSGATASALAPGNHLVEYGPISGYIAPSRETISLAPGQALTLSRSYTEDLDSLSVTLTPGTARWRVDGGEWQSSEAVILLSEGTHLVEYEEIAFHIRPVTETVNVSGSTALFRAHAAGGDLQLHPNAPILAERGLAQWRLNGGPWQPCGIRASVLPGTYTLEFLPVAGLVTPAQTQIEVVAGELLELDAEFTMPHRLRFFIHQDLAAGLSSSDLQARLSQYAAHLQMIWHRETARRFVFDPATDITVCAADPFSWSYSGESLPELGFEIWIYARLTDNPTFGTYGGNSGLDVSGAGGATNLSWDRIHDPSTLQGASPELTQYWRQIDHITHEFAHSFGAGIGEYYSLATLPDPTSVPPILPTVSFTSPAPGDPFWGTRAEYWADPLLVNIHGHWRAGSPQTLAALLDTIRFAPATKGVINGLCRRNGLDALPDLAAVQVRVVDAGTGLLIPGATCRAWNRQVDGTLGTFEQNVVPAAEAGAFTFAWTPYPDALPVNNRDNAKIVKAWATGYAPAAQWESLYDAQKARVWNLRDQFVITIALTPE